MEGNKDLSPVDRLTEGQRTRIERNREKARALRHARLTSHPYERASNNAASIPSTAKPKILQDTHGGFLLEEDETASASAYKLVEDNVPALPGQLMVCEECQKSFAESYLWGNFSLSVCDTCRDPSGKHSFITKTEAKQRYLLKECDFEERGGTPLKYLVRKNPHSYGDMKLYLHCQVEARAFQVWGGGEGLAEEQRRRAEAREKRQETKYVKTIKELRRSVNLTGLQSPRIHDHDYPAGEDVYDSNTDLWTKTCTVCGHQVTFEKL